MASSKISSKEKWEKAQALLERTLKKEIGMMREVLANLHQEELALLERDTRSFLSVMKDRSDLVMQLISSRRKRLSASDSLEELAKSEGRKELLPANEESSCEILTKLDQVIALLERINLQNCRNDALFTQAREARALPLECAYPHPLHKKKRSQSVATYLKKP